MITFEGLVLFLLVAIWGAVYFLLREAGHIKEHLWEIRKLLGDRD